MSDDWTALSEQSAADAQVYLLTSARSRRVTARGHLADGAARPVAGARHGRPARCGGGGRAGRRFEPDAGPDAELDPLRESLANVFEGLDEYADVADPVIDPEPTVGYLSNDLVDIAFGPHPRAEPPGGRPTRRGAVVVAVQLPLALGRAAASALRVIQALLAHVRLDADPDAVSEAEFDALHP